jgi:curved DNA-binding protein
VGIPAGAKSGQKLRLKGRGIPADPPGDIYVELLMVTPEAKAEPEKALYEKMESEMAFNPRIELGV